MKKIILIAVLAILPALCWGQGKVYTKKARMEDFSNRITKVVVDGESMLALTFKEEIMSRWRISPFEFCTSEEYAQIKGNNNYFFLSLVIKEDVAFMQLSRGGNENADMLHRPFEVVSLPFAADGASTGQEFSFLGAIVDVLQNFTEASIESDMIGYASLSSFSTGQLKGKTVYMNPTEADKAMNEGRADAVCGIIISPINITKKSYCYRMLISADTHELYYFKQLHYRQIADRYFTDNEAKEFEKRNGTVVR